jgi:hypothetical protein
VWRANGSNTCTAISLLRSTASLPAIGALDPEPQSVYCVDPKEPAGGQEEDFDVFARRFTVCVEATVAARTESSIVYVEDMA